MGTSGAKDRGEASRNDDTPEVSAAIVRERRTIRVARVRGEDPTPPSPADA